MKTPPKSGTPLPYWNFIIPMFSLNFCVFVDHLMMIPLSGQIARDIGMSIENSAMLVSAYPFAAAVSLVLLAPFSDRIGRKRMLLFLTIGFAFATLGITFSKNIILVFLFRILAGVFGGPIVPNALAFAGDSFEGPLRTRALTNLMLAFSVSSILGVPFGAALGDMFGWEAAFYAVSTGSFLCCLILLKLQAVPTGAERGRISRQYVELISLWKEPYIRRVFYLQIFMMIGLFGMVPNLSAWLGTNWQMTSTQIGLLYTQGGVAAVISNILAGRLMRAGYKLELITAGSLIMGVTMMMFTLEFFTMATAGLVFAGIMFGGTIRMPAFQIILSEIVDISRRGRLMSMSMIVANMIMGLGGIWSTLFLKMENNRLEGMPWIGVIGVITLFMVPVMVYRLKPYIPSSRIKK
ncbi:MAG: MFS transporter [SAR324 cluster bacterium]|nr:MFS transporter [SAR324 cluster bacterium]